MDIQGATALVTGASKRIGRALALALADNGCNVAIHYNTSQTEALETKAHVKSRGVHAAVIQTDLANASECHRLWKDAVELMGVTPNILVNNASSFARASLDDVSADAFDHAIAVNVRAPMLLAQAMNRDLAPDRIGKIFNINDRRQVYRSRFTYTITNTALTGMTKALAVSLAPRIQVNELRLGVIMPLSDDENDDAPPYSSQTLGPAQRTGTLEEVAQTVISVIQNDYINGASINVDGGLSAID